jgi:DNA-binding Lrp family transcriptional regulator
VDPKSALILTSLQKLGEATTNEIRQATGLDASETQYRRNKLADLELIDLVKRETNYGTQYEWSLTGTAQRELERGLGAASNWLLYEDYDGDEVDPIEFQKMQEELKQLRESQKASAYDQRDKDVIDRDEFEEFETYVYEWMEAAETYLRGIRSVIERYVPGVDNIADHIEGQKQD